MQGRFRGLVRVASAESQL